jgi:hypothetical protein
MTEEIDKILFVIKSMSEKDEEWPQNIYDIYGRGCP